MRNSKLILSVLNESPMSDAEIAETALMLASDKHVRNQNISLSARAVVRQFIESRLVPSLDAYFETQSGVECEQDSIEDLIYDDEPEVGYSEDNVLDPTLSVCRVVRGYLKQNSQPYCDTPVFHLIRIVDQYVG